MHTPGPWFVEQGGIEQDHDADRSIFSRTQSGNFRWIARAYGEGILAKASAERQANARLIALAPELADALRALFANCAMVHRYWGDANNATEAQRAIDHARALLARLDAR